MKTWFDGERSKGFVAALLKPAKPFTNSDGRWAIYNARHVSILGDVLAIGLAERYNHLTTDQQFKSEIGHVLATYCDFHPRRIDLIAESSERAE